MLESLKSFLIVLRHLVRLRGRNAAHGFEETLAVGEELLGPLPTLRRLLEHRARRHLDARALRSDFGAYLGEVERIVAAVDGLDV